MLFNSSRRTCFFQLPTQLFKCFFLNARYIAARLLETFAPMDACSSNSFSLFSRYRMDRGHFCLHAPTVLFPACEIRPEFLWLFFHSSAFPSVLSALEHYRRKTSPIRNTGNIAHSRHPLNLRTDLSDSLHRTLATIGIPCIAVSDFRICFFRIESALDTQQTEKED